MIRSFLADRGGATAVEYGLIAALISLAFIAGAGDAHNAISDMYQRIANRFDSVN